MSTDPPKTSPPRRRLPAAERRALIEEAATALFTERGYHGTAIDEVARRAGVSPPVLYDHFASKVALHRRLLERTRDELLAMWRESLGGGGTREQQVVRAFTAWAAYVHSHPYAPRMFFRETTGIPEVRAIHDEVTAEASGALAELVGGLAGPPPADPAAQVAVEMAAEVIRGGLTELAIWWADHPDVPAEAIVATAMNTVWVGFERVAGGEAWRPAA